MLKIVREFAKKSYKSSDIHGYPHIERVYNLCLQIARELDLNIENLKIAALLHDIGRFEQLENNSKRNHAEISARLAEKFLNSGDFKLTRQDIENILHSIRAHSFSNDIAPRTLEAKVLSDADKLDAIGAIGLYRTIGYTIQKHGNLNDVIKHLEEKIMKIKGLLFLDVSKRIAEQRQKIILNFYN
ncbi:MAG: HD domain-containing protein, partial [Candidatus Methylarchaceae archaeon HK02M2]|nr:HD domain-containing protein [Candidatus Methylarchaceae archaeon HK02M2]